MSSPSEWRKALEELPSTPDKIPSFFFSHGSPALAFSEVELGGASNDPMMAHHGPNGLLANFLKDFGPVLLEKYKPKGIVVFSAHWETLGERLVTDYGYDQPLLMDYYGFPPNLYKLKFVSRGDTALSNRVVELYKQHGHSARITTKLEPRGRDGRGFEGPGLDHGVFVPFRLMFGEKFTEIPIVQVSFDSSLSPENNWNIGKVVSKLREEGILVLSGGLTAHNLNDRRSMSPTVASEKHKAFDRAIHSAISISNAEQRKKAMFDLTQQEGFRESHPREDHFIPLYIAGGAGEGGEVRVLSSLYGAPTFVFGI